MGRLDGKRTIVTGAASGIGRAAARLFAAEGAKVLAVDRDEAGLEETRAAIASDGGTVLAAAADVSDETQARAYVDACVDAWGGLEAIYANAGILEPARSLFEISPDEWRRVLDINLIGPFLALKYAAPVMKDAGGGSIVFTASTAGLRANAGPHAYSASKAGVISLARTAANELSATNVRVNAICPGLVETGMTKGLFDGARARGTDHKIGQLNPLKRPGLPEEIARMALFLASDDSSYVNGQAFAVDGGLSSTHPFVVR